MSLKRLLENNKSNSIFIAAGDMYADIDVFACALVLEKACHLAGFEKVKAIVSGGINSSVPKCIQELGFDYLSESVGIDLKDANYIIVDISDHNHISKSVNQENIVALFDHHFGFEDYWHSRLGDNAVIETIGSCATLIWEHIGDLIDVQRLDPKYLLLLYSAIISNTLNLQAGVTRERDVQALQKIKVLGNIKDDWDDLYFSQVSQAILNDPVIAMKNDTYEIDVGGQKYAPAQLELWDASGFVKENENLILKFLDEFSDGKSFLTVPNISQGINYIVTKDDFIKSFFNENFGVVFDGNIGKSSKIFLRKEIVKKMRERL